MIYFKTSTTLYSAEIIGRMEDRDWDNRESKAITLDMTYAEAIDIFVDDMPWSIVDETEDETVEYDNSEFCIAGDITDHRDGTITVKMGKPTDLELAYEELYG